MKKTNACVFGLMALAASFAHAETYDATTGYVTLLRNDTDDKEKRSLGLAANWSDELPPHEGTNYYIRAGLVAQGPDSNFTFPASLVAAGDVRCRGNFTGTFTDLKILAGGGIRFTDKGSVVAGKITFLSDGAENPSLMKFGNKDL